MIAEPSNRLATETSPYLLLHATNPVDWYPWGGEAFDAARRLDKPILLSVGYSTCYWCHVMERESFADVATATVLNDAFVCIKVDREERPDLDEQYMQAVQLLTGSGGWPMTVMLTHDLKPFYGGTYYPPDQLRRVVAALSDVWRNDRERLLASAEELTTAMARGGRPAAVDGDMLTQDDIASALDRMLADQDSVHGGQRGAPKFPQDMADALFIAAWQHGGRDELLAAALRSLDAMALGGIHDHVGGGFHRYSTDGMWAVPHFEKMLYNQAGLLRAYADAAAATGSWWYRQIARDIVGFVRRELTDGETGAFLTALDAETDGREGLYYLWSPAEMAQILGGQADRFAAAFRTTDVPDHHAPRGRDPRPGVLSLVCSPATPAVASDLGGLCAQLLAARDRRPRPLTDDKVLCAWNGLMAGALAHAGWLLDEPDWVAVAERSVAFVLARLRDGEGRLLHQWRLGQAKQAAFLDDYAALANACLDLWLATGDARWRVEAAGLASEMTQRFAAEDGAFHGADAEATDLLLRSKPMFDNAMPCGNSLAADLLYRLARYDEARRTVATLAPLARRYPHGLANLVRVALTGDPANSTASGSARHVHASVRSIDDGVLELRVRLTPGYHVERLSLRTADGELVPVVSDEGSGLRLRATLPRRPESQDLWLSAQVCGDGACLPESTLRFRVISGS